MKDDSDSFIQEVDEQVRADQLLAQLKIYGPWLLGALAAVIIGVIGADYWRSMQTNAARQQSDAFAAAEQQAQGAAPAAAAAAFQPLTSQGPDSYRVMAMMERAGALEAGGDLQAALAEFDHAANSAKDPLMRDTARLRAAYIVADTQDFTAVQARVQPLIAEKNQISYLARELLAVEAWQAGQYQLARDTLNAISLSFDAPESLRERARVELSVIGQTQPAQQSNTAVRSGDTK
ncbi:MAG: tetratricopeptide repeat protein [Pseudomonadota bacterium]